MRVSCSIKRRGLTVAAGVVAAVLTACGGDFEYKTSGDRIDGGNRAGIADWDGASTTSHENLMSIQEQYQAKVKAESGQK
ncbi:MAG: hypothetical protein OXG17_01070 [Chloroflexi bacterium]|nr:hypothetical protein [Chloroflexota bacterium]